MGKCTSCGYRGQLDPETLVRKGPKCQGTCRFVPDKAPDPNPPMYETGDVVRWGEDLAVVIDQVSRSGFVLVANTSPSLLRTPCVAVYGRTPC